MINEQYLTYEDAFKFVQETINKKLLSSPKLILKYMKHLSLSQGKYIRANSVLTCALNEDEKVHRDAIYFAAAIELLHLASLVHDDVIDDADTRRGVPTLQKLYGKKTAVICGDYLLCTSLQMLKDIPDKEAYGKFELTDYISKLCLGELLQETNINNLDLSIHQYLKIIRGKTAALFEASFHIGALLSIGQGKDLKRYVQLGRYMGMLFQLTDDCIDFEAEEKDAKKPVHSDLRQGVVTLPVIFTIKKDASFVDLVRDTTISINQIHKKIMESGAILYTKKVSRKYYDKSVNLMEMLDLTNNKRNRLIILLDQAMKGIQK